MTHRFLFRSFITVILPLLALLPGCAPALQGYGPHFYGVDREIKKVAIIQPDFSAYEISGGGIPEYRVDWSRTGKANLSASVQAELAKKGVEGFIANADSGSAATDSIGLFVRYVATAIQTNLYDYNPFLAQIDSFTYSIGAVGDLCNQYDADAVLFLFGVDENHTELRKKTLRQAAVAKTVRSAIFSTIFIVLLGSGAFRTYEAPLERTYLCCLVANRNGRIIWYTSHFKADNADLRKRSDTEKLAQNLLGNFRHRKSKQ